MSNGTKKVSLVRLAERWHERHMSDLDHDHSSCWCCCITCDHSNPHFDNAVAEMEAADVE